MNERQLCPVCGCPATVHDGTGGSRVDGCRKCSNYTLTTLALSQVESLTENERIRLSCWIRAHPGCKITPAAIPEILAFRVPSLTERANLLLSSIARMSTRVDERFVLGTAALDELCAVAWCEDAHELLFIAHEYLCQERGFIELPVLGGEWHVSIKPKGWFHLDSLQAVNSQSRTGFIAMWFDPQVNDAWRSIEQGIEAAGYQPLRIDQRQHNNKIDDEIIAAIRGSHFVVSDFTGHRGGVYFEAGFAMGLGIPVIWLCRKDELDRAHFDTRQYNFIVWEESALPELTKALKNRIEATIGRGPIPESSKPSATRSSSRS